MTTTNTKGRTMKLNAGDLNALTDDELRTLIEAARHELNSRRHAQETGDRDPAEGLLGQAEAKH